MTVKHTVEIEGYEPMTPDSVEDGPAGLTLVWNDKIIDARVLLFFPYHRVVHWRKEIVG